MGIIYFPLLRILEYQYTGPLHFIIKKFKKIQGTIDTAKNTVKFTIPDGFFAEERVGPLSHRLVIQDTDDVPTILSEIINDKLIIASPSLAELNI